MVQQLQNFYNEKIIPYLIKKFQYKNKYQVPALEKIVINRGLGILSQNENLIKPFQKELSLITGQQGVITKSKKAISNFKLKQKMPVGLVVTLRDERMYTFLDHLINLILPRIRNFKGVNPKSFDGHGNYSLGLKEQLLFYEIDFNDIKEFRGMDISIITTSKNDKVASILLEAFGMPFKK